MKQKIIFTIVNYNTRDSLEKCLESIKKTQSRENTVFVIDNASTDGSKEMVGKKYSWAKLMANGKNIGFGAAHNVVLKKEKYDFAVITNSDIIFQNPIEKTMKMLQQDNRIGACSIRLLNKDGTIQKNVFPMPSLRNETIARIPLAKDPYLSYNFDYGRTSEVECFNGACFIVRRKALEETGFFDEDFFAYAEETDLFFRMKKKGWKIFYCPGTSAIHLGGQTTKSGEKKHLMYFSNLLKFFRKNHGRLQEIILRAVAASSAMLDIPKHALLAEWGKKREQILFSIRIIKVCISDLL